MSEMMDTLEQTTLLVPEFQAAAPESDDELGEAISVLWNAHLNAKKVVRVTNEELRALRAQLGAQLAEMKQILAKPGRGGQWSAFLFERQIPRATADRLVARYQQSLNPQVNCSGESTGGPTEQEMREHFNSVLPRLQRFLRSPCSVYDFLAILVDHFQCGGISERGILVPRPPVAV